MRRSGHQFRGSGDHGRPVGLAQFKFQGIRAIGDEKLELPGPGARVGELLQRNFEDLPRAGKQDPPVGDEKEYRNRRPPASRS